MSNPSFCALVQFPDKAYFDFNSAMNGIATIDSISRESENYHANICFALKQMSECIAAINANSGTIIEIIPDKETIPAAVRNYVKRKGGKAKVVVPRGGDTKISKLRELLSGKWMTVKQLQKATGWPPSTIHARFTGLKKQKILRSKNGPQGRMVYQIAAAAA